VSAIGHGFPLPKPLIFSFGGLGGRLAEQVARDVDQREPPPFFGQFGGVGLDEYLDGLVAGISRSTAITSGPPSRLEMLSGPYEIRAPSSSMRLSVLFREDSTMTPYRLPLHCTADESM
jgi:hypothetical protein